MNDLKVFFNSEVLHSGTMSAIGDFGLTPVRYLCDGKTIEIGACLRIDVEQSFSKKDTTWLKTATAVTLLIPGLILAFAKLVSYFFADTRDGHKLAKECFVPSIKQIGSMKTPIQNQNELYKALEQEIVRYSHRPTGFLHIFSNCAPGRNATATIKEFEAERVILCGNVKMETLNEVLGQEYEIVQAQTLKQAHDAPLTRKSWFSSDCYPKAFLIPAPVLRADPIGKRKTLLTQI